MFVSVDLPMPGEPPSSTSEPGHEPAAEHAVELADRRSQPRRALGADVAQRHRPGGGTAPAAAAPPRAPRAGRALLHERVPLAAAGQRPCHFGLYARRPNR